MANDHLDDKFLGDFWDIGTPESHNFLILKINQSMPIVECYRAIEHRRLGHTPFMVTVINKGMSLTVLWY